MSKDKTTQREWDRAVGIGEVPEEVDDTCLSSPEHIEYFQTKLKRGLKFTNHEETFKRHPDNKDE